VYFSIFIVLFPSACRLHPGRDQQKRDPVLRPIAPHFLMARDLDAKPLTLSRVTRVAWLRHLHWVSANRVDIPQPAGGRRHHFSGLTQMWASAAETEGPACNFGVVASLKGIPYKAE
jgi:hypothetical protein